ncbi:unnamed protein product, partial [Polarella glacialis]
AVSASSQTIEVTWGEALLAAGASRPIQWEVAVFVANAASEHEVTVVPGTRVIRVRAPPVAVKCLQFYTAYIFRIRAFGEGGWSDWSDPSEPAETSEEWTDEEIVDYLMPRYGDSLANVFRGFDRNCDGFISQQ